MTEPFGELEHGFDDRWDRQALKDGGGVALMLVVPCTLIARLLAGSDGESSSGWSAFLALGALLGFVLGAGVAAWRQHRGTPMSLRAQCSCCAVFLGVQAVFTAIRIGMGDPVRGAGCAVSLTLALGGGLFGGILGGFLQRKGAVPYR
ncbi:MAG: hypothetical protein R2715_07170 [Ilumatobacteraceae bacterium]